MQAGLDFCCLRNGIDRFCHYTVGSLVCLTTAIYELRHDKTCLGFPTWSNTNPAVQPQDTGDG